MQHLLIFEPGLLPFPLGDAFPLRIGLGCADYCWQCDPTAEQKKAEPVAAPPFVSNGRWHVDPLLLISRSWLESETKRRKSNHVASQGSSMVKCNTRRTSQCGREKQRAMAFAWRARYKIPWCGLQQPTAIRLFFYSVIQKVKVWKWATRRESQITHGPILVVFMFSHLYTYSDFDYISHAFFPLQSFQFSAHGQEEPN